jgi:hypothetical protein
VIPAASAQAAAEPARSRACGPERLIDSAEVVRSRLVKQHDAYVRRAKG